MTAIQAIAKREHVSVGEWVRRTLRDARERQPVKDPETKLAAIREAMKYSFPAPTLNRCFGRLSRATWKNDFRVQLPSALSARDALHIAVMERHNTTRILSFDSDFDRWPTVERVYKV